MIAAILILGFLTFSQAAQVVVFGDSWGSFSRQEFQQMFTSRGHNIQVDNDAIGGTTARFWSLTPNALTDAVSKNPDCEWVWLTIGGNDGIYELAMGRDMEDIVNDVVNNTRKILDPLFRDHPNIKVVQFGYDIVNFEMSVTCRTLGRTIFPYCRGDIACSNTEMYNLQTAVEMINAYYKGHTVVDLRGSLQRAGGGVPAPFPNVNYYSPAHILRDCIHPNSDGFDALFDQLWEVYFKAEIEGKAQ